MKSSGHIFSLVWRIYIAFFWNIFVVVFFFTKFELLSEWERSDVWVGFILKFFLESSIFWNFNGSNLLNDSWSLTLAIYIKCLILFPSMVDGLNTLLLEEYGDPVRRMCVMGDNELQILPLLTIKVRSLQTDDPIKELWKQGCRSTRYTKQGRSSSTTQSDALKLILIFLTNSWKYGLMMKISCTRRILWSRLETAHHKAHNKQPFLTNDYNKKHDP